MSELYLSTNEKNIFRKEHNWCNFHNKYLRNASSCGQYTSNSDVDLGKLIYFTLIEKQRNLSGPEKELQKMLEELRKDDYKTYAELGHYYKIHFNDEESQKYMFYYFKTAADKGCAESQYNTAICFLNGWGVQKDEKKVIEYMVNSKKSGYWQAAYWLGIYYHEKMILVLQYQIIQ